MIFLTSGGWSWSSGEGGTLSAAASAEIEKVRLDPRTSFPVKVKITHRDSPHEVTLEGPLSAAATAIKVQESAAMETDEPDMSAFRAGASQTSVAITRRVRTQRPRPFSEFIVYDTAQARLKYLIELRSPHAVKSEWRRERSVLQANRAA